MKTKMLFTFLIALGLSAPVLADAERIAKQAKLDKLCEEARAKKLKPLKAKNIEDCAKKRKLAECELQYENYGERVGKKVPLFYNLPECVKADEYLKSERSTG